MSVVGLKIAVKIFIKNKRI